MKKLKKNENNSLQLSYPIDAFQSKQKKNLEKSNWMEILKEEATITVC